MNWRGYFAGTIIKRAGKYYKQGRVTNLENYGDVYSATVIGTVPYHVKIWKKANNQPGMSCTCPYAVDGGKCKHMAAVLMKIEDETGNFDIFRTIEKQKPLKVDEEVKPFKEKNLPGAKEYICFDLAKMTRNIKIKASQFKDAQNLVENNDIRLESVRTGYDGFFRNGTLPAGSFVAYCKDGEEEKAVSMKFNSDEINEASCRVTGCGKYFYTSYHNNIKTLCKHQLAALLLLEKYVDEYNPGDTTDFLAVRMMESYRKHQRQQRKWQRQQLLEADSNEQVKLPKVQLFPKLERDYKGFEMTFRIGDKKLYVVRNVNEVVDNVEGRQILKLGTKTEIDFALREFTPDSQRYYNILRRVVNEERTRAKIDNYYAYSMSRNVSKIRVYGSMLDEMFEIMFSTDGPILYLDRYSENPETYLYAKEGTPVISLTIDADYEDNVFKGIEVSGILPDIIKGDKYRYYIEGSVMYRIEGEKIGLIEPLFEMGNNGQVRFKVGRKALADFYYYTLPMLDEVVRITDNVGDVINEYLPPQVTYRFYLDAEKDNITCEAKAVYGETQFSLMEYYNTDGYISAAAARRDLSSEQEAFSAVKGYCREADMERGLFVCKGDDAVCRMLESGINELMTFGEVFCTDKVKSIRFHKKTPITVGVSLESGLMELNISADDLSQEELLEVLNGYRQKKKYHRLSNGDFVNTEDENIAMLASMMDTLHISSKEFLKENLHIPAYRALYLDKILEKNDTLYVERDKHFKNLVKEFKTMEDSDYELPKSLKKVMRPYQETGFKWLRTLEAYGFGGILADDMGLGKTLQIISVLLKSKEENKKGVSLIISPASLIYNWQEEVKKFAPGLKTLLISGTRAERKKMLSGYEAYDVVITSYDLLKRDIDEYEDKKFLYQVIDEAQYIKNHSTAAAKAVKCIQSKVKYALTGTPIENRLSELWSIFDYLMPGFLYGYETFRKELESPVVKNNDEEASMKLKHMVAPFIMRRLKQDVLKDLPDKLEEIQYAAFDGRQRKLYDGESAKRNMCMELVKRVIEGEHRALIFSQFTSMLSLLEEDLKRENIAFYKITGSTKKEDRIRLVKQFNEGAVLVFLISLKAGGTGLNLTGADTVIHYDPWWNQAVQNQATDRAHRIGQKKVVTVYKLIVKDSIEEKIVRMQELKKNLADEILSGENGSLTKLSKDELLELLH